MAREPASHLIEQPVRETSGPRPLGPGLVVSLRPRQWTKNLIIFGALILGDRLLDLPSVLRSVAAFAVFCALSGAVYLVNDVADRDADRLHPIKRR
ncbi:MAG TPA: hypothetical protein VLD67_05340, partial [Vicinamibacterales bacterium]|nr:hypothetical protein [Vicinamibacterales bacterium]